MKTPEQLADERLHEAFGVTAGGNTDSAPFTWWGIRDQIAAAIYADRAQRPIITTLTHDARGVEVGIWPAHPELDGNDPAAIVVQIDTGASTGRIRVNLNDAPIWDGDPMTDSHPGAHFQED